MKKLLLTSILILTIHESFCQTNHFVGLNLNQLPATSLDLNYQMDIFPFASLSTEVGITFNYQKNIDIIGNLLSSHCDCIDQFDIDKTNGGHLKIGALLNLRKSFEKANYFNFGVYLNQSVVHQLGEMNEYHPDYIENGDNNVKQTLYIIGFSGFIGYNLKISSRLSANLGFQVSFASDRAWDLYGISNYIPGMGLNEMSTVFPMFVINLKYKIK